MSEQRKPAEHFFVNGIVAQRDKQPYVQLSNEYGIAAQLNIAQARQIAADILQMAARTEADAMILKFFSISDFPEGFADALMMQFRDYRADLDKEEAERTR